MAASLVALMMLDAAFSLAPAFNFDTNTALVALGEIRHLDAVSVLLALVGMSLVGASAILVTPNTAHRLRGRRAAVVYGVTLVVALAADSINGLGYFGRRSSVVVPVNVATSQLYRAQRVMRRSYAGRESGETAPERVPAATDGLRKALEADGGLQRPIPVLLVLVESFGAFSDSAIAEGLRRRFQTPRIRARFSLRSGTLPFEGATTEAEFRELCGTAGGFQSAPRQALTSCLPGQLGLRGYETVALHGYTGLLFGRTSWYPLLGFDRIMFRPELQKVRKLPDCGIAFRGVCDYAFLPLLAKELKSGERPRFVYWLTLSTHFPLDPRVASTDVGCNDLGIERPGTLCLYARSVWTVLDVVARLAEDSSIPPVWYIVVGDHAPPVLAAREDALDGDRVPYFELRPR